MARKKRPRQQSAAPTKTIDGYDNFVSRLGLQSGNLSGHGTYMPNFTSRNRVLLEFAYRSSWIVGAAVDTIADDMTRKGVTITSQMDHKAKARLTGRWEELSLWEGLSDTIKWSRLYGGAVGVLLIDGQDMSSPLRMETIGRDQFKGMLVLDRWMLNQTITEIITEPGPDLGKPKYYEVVAAQKGIPAWKIHHSRLIRMDGVGLPYQQAYTENGWGMSVVERLYDRIMAFDSASTGAAQLVNKAHLRTYSIEKLREILGLGDEREAALMKHIDMIRLFQSIEGMTLMDKSDEFQTHSYSFAGLSDILSQFGEQIAGATGIPLIRMLGQSPAGFSTGESDLANYYDNVGSHQERRARRPVRRLFEVIHRSEFGTPLPDDFDFEFNPLWQMSDLDRSTVAKNTVDTLNAAIESGLMPLHAGMAELRESSRVTGIGSNITDEDIENAKGAEPPGFTEESDDDAPDPQAGANQLFHTATQDSAGSGRHRKWPLRWFK
ncbi:DUF1073 domain-containing protein [Pantoea stewartii]|uniref:DUF1073 domain-containing protein n=1 Tax=Pantoea stewartii TaxID=66269 RepID=UPI003368FA58